MLYDFQIAPVETINSIRKYGTIGIRYIESYLDRTRKVLGPGQEVAAIPEMGR